MKKFSFFLIRLAFLFCLKISANSQWEGSLYSENSKPQAVWFEEFSGGIPITGKEDVLDLGCGDGKLTLEIAKRLTNGSIHGLDMSKSMIDFAKKSYIRSNLDFSVGDARSFSLNKKFDLIVSFTALHWVKEYEQVIQRAKQHLKPNGRIYFIFSAKWQYLPLNKAMDTLYKTEQWAPYFKDYTPGYYMHGMDNLFDILNRNGFSVKEMTLKSKLTIFKTEDEFFAWLKAWLPQQNQVPNEKKDLFIHDFISEYKRYRTVNSKGIYWEGYSLKTEASLNVPMP